MLDKIKEMFHTFAYIETGALFACALFITVFQRDSLFTVSLLWQLLATTFLCVCGNLIYPARRVSEKLTKVLIFFHFLYVNAVVFGCAYFFDWFDVTNIAMDAFMFSCIAVIFLTIARVIWIKNRLAAELLNYRLKAYQGKKETYQGIKETYQGIKETYQGIKETCQGKKETYQDEREACHDIKESCQGEQEANQQDEENGIKE